MPSLFRADTIILATAYPQEQETSPRSKPQPLIRFKERLSFHIIYSLIVDMDNDNSAIMEELP